MPQTQQDQRTLNIAVADDDEEWIALFSQAAGELAINVNLFFLNDGLQLMRFFDETTTIGLENDLVILDLRMPHFDGHQVLKQMEASGLIKEVPVVVFTSSTSEFDRLKALSNGAMSYETKPRSYPEFLEFVASLPALAKKGQDLP